MRIGIDIRCLMEKNYSGVCIYTQELLKAMFEADKSNNYVLFYNSAQELKVPKFDYPNVSVFENTIPNKIFNASIKFFQKPHIDELVGGLDVLFLPNIQFVSVSKKCKIVTTIHDISFERYPQFYTARARIWQFAIHPKNLCERSNRIISVSQNTKNDLHDVYGVDPNKIRVIYSGVSEYFRPIDDKEILQAVKKKYSLPETFFLYLGNLEPRKNIDSIITVFQRNKIPQKTHLVIAGANAWKYKQFYAMAEKLKDRIHFIGYVDERDKPALYSLSQTFLYPSYYEGFGFPPLEAMACGVPVIASNTSSLPEITNNASILVDPYNINDIESAVHTLFNDLGARKILIERGIRRASLFRWSEAARQTIDVLCSP